MTAVDAAGSPAATIETLLPYTGWLLALALILFALRRFFERFFAELGNRFAGPFLRWFASRDLTRRAMSRYRAGIEKNYGTHALGFRGAQPVLVREIYVPLQYLTADGHRRDVVDAITGSQRILITGEPGAGKSLLMKHLLTTWATRSSSRVVRKVPVLVELHRCNDPTVTIEGLVRQSFTHNGVRGRESLVDRSLVDGRLLVLLDGLDEVSRDNQARVITMIKDLVRTYDGSAYLVTCRSAVYTGQLAAELPDTVILADFDDAGIRRLLANWRGLDTASANRFFTVLADSPQLMRLAGSPLLLTMMVHLQTEVLEKSGQTISGSRSRFYDDAVEHLLSRDSDLARDRSLAVYESVYKRAALQRVALAMQKAPREQPDRRTIDRHHLRAIIKQSADDLNLRDEDIDPMITEIVDRSQLLVGLDGRSSRFAFRHLTLQEYFAASALRYDPDQLLSSYAADPDGWRETVRLWCGGPSLDCTAVVQQVFEGDEAAKVLALQCMAEATILEKPVADRIRDHFLAVLAAAPPSPVVADAMGASGSDARPRGRGVLAELCRLMETGVPGHADVARALGATRLPTVAAFLGHRIGFDEDARRALRTMGEQAIPEFETVARDGDLRSVDDLGEIRTASAAAALGTLVWDESPIAFRAAWWLADLVRHPEIEEGLRPLVRTPPPEAMDSMWVWLPVAPKEPFLMFLLGRVTDLLRMEGAPDPPPQVEVVDHRIAIAVIAFEPGCDRHIRQGAQPFHDAAALRRSVLRRLQDLPGVSSRSTRDLDMASVLATAYLTHPDDVEKTITELLDVIGLPDRCRRVFHRMPRAVQFLTIGDVGGLGGVVTSEPFADTRLWTQATTVVAEPKLLSEVLWTVLTFLGFFALAAAAVRSFGPWFGLVVSGPAWLAVTGASAVGVVLLGILVLVVNLTNFLGLEDATDFIFDDPILYTLFGGGVVVAITASVVAFEQLGPAWALGLLTSVAIVCGGLKLVIDRRRLRIANPFRMYLTLTEGELTSLVGDRDRRLAYGARR